MLGHILSLVLAASGVWSEANLHGEVEAPLGSGNHSEEHEVKHGSIHVASWRFGYVEFPFIITGFIILISVVKIGKEALKSF